VVHYHSPPREGGDVTISGNLKSFEVPVLNLSRFILQQTNFVQVQVQIFFSGTLSNFSVPEFKKTDMVGGKVEGSW